MKKICFLLGDPVEHSLSSIMQNAAFVHLNLDIVYKAVRVSEDELGNRIKKLREKDILGANVTLPHKIQSMEFIDSIDETAKKIGAINTIVNENGKLKGFNTDALGFGRTMKENKVTLKNANVVLFGAGGAARAITFQCIFEGADVTIINRNLERAKNLAKHIKQKLKKEIKVIPLSEKTKLKKEIVGADVLINGTSVGMFPKVNESIIPINFLHSNLVIMDIVYNPIETKLLRDAKEICCKKTINGIEMLIHQGALAFELWTGKKAPINLMRKVVTNELKK